MKLSVVIPAYNEQDNILETAKELISIIKTVGAISAYQIVVVDDHSSDVTYQRVDDLKDKNILALRLSRRSGSHTALRAGLRCADGDAVLCVSADGQDNPQYLKQMIEKWQKGARVVWGLRKSRGNEPWYVSLPAKLFYKILIYLEGSQDGSIDLQRADFYLLDAKVVKAINSYAERKTSLFGLILWTGFNHDFIEYDRRDRKHGASKWNFRSRVALARDWIVAFSGVPLKLVSLVGFGVAVLGFVYALVVVMNVFFGKPVEGWSSLTILILILGGVQMIMLGVLGEYVWQNLEESRKRPLFFIEKQTQES